MIEQWHARKVVIVGAGDVGSTFAYALAQNGLADEIAIMDLNAELAKGQVLDLGQGAPYFRPVRFYEAQKSDYSDAHVIVITAGAKQKPDESRLNLLRRNAGIIEGVVNDIVEEKSQAVIIVVTNPVDVLTYIAWKRSGWPRGRVIGSGTVLDSARFRYLLSQLCDIDVHNIHGYILGEHGDSEFAAWSLTHLAGMAMDDYCAGCRNCGDWKSERKRIEEEVKNSAYHIIDYKGSTHFAVGLALTHIVTAILRNQKSVLSVSTVLDGEYGLSGVSLSVPCLVSGKGIERVLEVGLSSHEQEALNNSARLLQSALSELRK